jgi:hypothetical protein
MVRVLVGDRGDDLLFVTVSREEIEQEEAVTLLDRREQVLSNTLFGRGIAFNRLSDRRKSK